MTPTLFNPYLNQTFDIQKHTHILVKKSQPITRQVEDPIREQIIRANLNAKTSEVYVLREDRSFKRVSQWEIFVTSLKLTYAKGESWKAIAYLVGAIALTILAGTLIYGIYSALSRSFLWLFPGAYGLVSLGVMIMVSILENPLFINYQKIKEGAPLTSDSVMKLEKIAFHTGNIQTLDLQNYRNSEGEVQDPIMFEAISKEELNSPRTLVISNCAYPLKLALTTMVQRLITLKNDTGQILPVPVGALPHPLENRFLNEKEKQKFLQDICSLFCLGDPQTVIDCWDVSDTELDVTANELAENHYGGEDWRNNLIQDQDFKRAYLKKQLTPNVRMQKFLRLLPPNIRNDFFSDIKFHIEFTRDFTAPPIAPSEEI